MGPLRLYEYPRSRCARVRWVLAVLGLEYESVPVDLVKGEQRSAEFLAVNPCGKVPVLVDGGTVVTESAAICTWLAERYPDKGLIPPEGSVERGHYYQWTFFCMAELEPCIWSMRKHMLIYPRAVRSRAAIRLAREEYRDNVACLSRQIGNAGFVLGETFTAADIIIGFNLLWAQSLKLLADFPQLHGYLDGLKRRPSFPRQFL